MEEVCGDCLQLVAAIQLELGTDTAFTQALVAHAEQACEGLAPDLAQQVRMPAPCWAPSSSSSSMSPRHGSIFCSCLLLSSSPGGWGVLAGW